MAALAACSSGAAQQTPAAPQAASDAVASPAGLRTAATKQIAGFTAEMPRAAGAFVDSIGVNTHLGDLGSPYVNAYGTFVGQIEALGIHHVRDGMLPGRTDLCQKEQQLASAGIRFSYVTPITSAPGDYATWASCTAGAIEGFESVNEYDLTHPASDTNWPATLAAYQRQFYAAVKGTSATAGLDVIGPALTSGSAYAAVGNLSAYEDVGNMHDYFDGRNPGTPGWGSGGYGSIAYNIAAAQPASLSRSIDATETGFPVASTPIAPNVTEWIAGKYVPRLFLDQWNAGVPRTWLYEFYDEGAAPFNTYGLVDANAVPKWPYWSLKNLISVLQDGALTLPNAGPLYWSMSGQTWNVDHAILQKADGSCFLALWVEWPSNDPNTGAPYSIPPQNVTISLPLAPKTASVYAYDSRMNLNATTIVPSTAITLSLTDTVTLLRMHW